MLARYQIVRGKRAPSNSLPSGVRQDTRKHTRHFLRPDPEAVELYLAEPSEPAWRRFHAEYRATLAQRFARDRAPFDALAQLARSADVYLGCSCPTRKNPDVYRCHTTLALAFMAENYRSLEVVWPTG